MAAKAKKIISRVEVSVDFEMKIPCTDGAYGCWKSSLLPACKGHTAKPTSKHTCMQGEGQGGALEQGGDEAAS